MIKVLFRAIAGGAFGWGHVSRCVVLANEFGEDFYCGLAVSPTGFLSEFQKSLLSSFDFLIEVEQGQTDEQDAISTSQIFLKEGFDVLFTDLCHRDLIDNYSKLKNYHALLRGLGVKNLATIGDCRLSETGADLTFIPYDCSEKQKKDLKLVNNTYQGLEFFVTSFAHLDFKEKKLNDPLASKLLVFISASDPLGITPDVLAKLRKLELEDLTVVAITTGAMSKKTSVRIKDICKESPNFKTTDFSLDFFKHVLWADIAITGEGLVKYETTSAGTPTLVISQFDHDSDNVLNFFKQGYGVYLGSSRDLTLTGFENKIASVIKNKKLRDELSSNGMGLIDGKGPDRIKTLIYQHFG